MLVTSSVRYLPTAVNMLILQGRDGKYYYVHRSLYDQCVILRDQYLNLLPSFYKLFGYEAEHPAVCDEFMKVVPEPLDILGPFLTLVAGCEELTSVEDMCGALSSMSMSIDFRKMFKVPPAVRQSIKFSLSVREEYRVQWDRFFLETPTLEQISSVPVHTAAAAVYGAANSEDDEDEEITYADSGPYSTDNFLSRLASPPVDEAAGKNEDEDDVSTPAPKSGFYMLKGL